MTAVEIDGILISMEFPNNKQFAFTIIDDTDNAEIENIRPVYEFLAKLGFKITKTVWSLPPRDTYKGLSLKNYPYRQFIKMLQREGFEIALHSVGSGRMTRQDTIDGLEIFKQFIGHYPKIQINHGENPDSIYWGIKRFHLLKLLWRYSHFQGENPNSAFFWGDYHKKNIKYTRNFTYHGLNTIKSDPFMPYTDKNKPLAKFWFSSSDGSDLEKFNRLVNQRSIDRLIKEKGTTIVYTHFASGFIRGGRLNREFQQNMVYLSRRNGYFVPAGALLDYLESKGRGKEISGLQKTNLELKWVWDKIKGGFKRS